MPDKVENHTIELLKKLHDKIDDRFDKTDARLDRIERRLKTVEHQIIGLRHDEAGSAKEQGELRDDIDTLFAKVAEIEKRLSH